MWQKSRRSSDTANCVEVWQKSSFSGWEQCVEVANDTRSVLVRDSKDPDGPRLSFDASSWAAFLAGTKAGEFDMGDG